MSLILISELTMTPGGNFNCGIIRIQLKHIFLSFLELSEFSESSAHLVKKTPIFWEFVKCWQVAEIDW